MPYRYYRMQDEQTRKFAKQLGTVDDFVRYLAMADAVGNIRHLENFLGTNGSGGPRYLLVNRGGIIDFRHFFAAMLLRTHGFGGFKPSPEGKALLLGVGNEMMQCFQEAWVLKLNSCFAKEDLTSNRLGAQFGQRVLVAQSEASRHSTATLLRSYLISLDPVAPGKIEKIKLPSSTMQVGEVVWAVLKAFSDTLVPSAF